MATNKGSTTVKTENHNSYFQAQYIKQSQAVGFSSVAVNSRIISDTTSLIRLFATQDCWVSIGASGSAVAAACVTNGPIVSNVAFIPGGVYEYLGIPGAVTNPIISVISNGSDGVLHILEGN